MTQKTEFDNTVSNQIISYMKIILSNTLNKGSKCLFFCSDAIRRNIFQSFNSLKSHKFVAEVIHMNREVLKRHFIRHWSTHIQHICLMLDYFYSFLKHQCCGVMNFQWMVRNQNKKLIKNILILCVFYGFATTWGWVNDNRAFGWTIPLNI